MRRLCRSCCGWAATRASISSTRPRCSCRTTRTSWPRGMRCPKTSSIDARATLSPRATRARDLPLREAARMAKDALESEVPLVIGVRALARRGHARSRARARGTRSRSRSRGCSRRSRGRRSARPSSRRAIAERPSRRGKRARAEAAPPPPPEPADPVKGAKPAIDRGAHVRALAGPFAGQAGVVQELDGKGGARVLFGLLAARVELRDLTIADKKRGRPVLSSSHRKPSVRERRKQLPRPSADTSAATSRVCRRAPLFLGAFQLAMNRVDWLSKSAIDAVFGGRRRRARSAPRRSCSASRSSRSSRASASRYFMFNAGRDVEYELRRAARSRSSTSSASAFYRRMSAGEIMSRATNDLGQVRLLFGFGVLNVVNVVFAFASALQVMLAISLAPHARVVRDGARRRLHDAGLLEAALRAYARQPGDARQARVARAGQPRRRARRAQLRARGSARCERFRAIEPGVPRREPVARAPARLDGPDARRRRAPSACSSSSGTAASSC